MGKELLKENDNPKCQCFQQKRYSFTKWRIRRAKIETLFYRTFHFISTFLLFFCECHCERRLLFNCMPFGVHDGSTIKSIKNVLKSNVLPALQKKKPFQFRFSLVKRSNKWNKRTSNLNCSLNHFVCVCDEFVCFFFLSFISTFSIEWKTEHENEKWPNIWNKQWKVVKDSFV